MSRSQDTTQASNPSQRWFEWNGEHGKIRWYDKVKKENVDVSLPFSFMLLDQLSTVKGWCDRAGCGIYSNEVRSTTSDPLVVKLYDGSTIAKGLYREIKPALAEAGGKYVASIYLAFKDDEDRLVIGNLGLKGAALNAWVDFVKDSQKTTITVDRGGEVKKVSALYGSAIQIHGSTKDKKGKVVYHVPKFRLVALSAEADLQATELDKELQEYLATKKVPETTGPVPKQQQPELVPDSDPEEEAPPQPEADDDDLPEVPF